MLRVLYLSLALCNGALVAPAPPRALGARVCSSTSTAQRRGGLLLMQAPLFAAPTASATLLEECIVDAESEDAVQECIQHADDAKEAAEALLEECILDATSEDGVQACMVQAAEMAESGPSGYFQA